ncbi:hypothetical protein EC957_000552 [Mortierella hygrophila]|uniref:RING-type E3 ubiquitin transferase n=1 Tax=Mortierella hygrophila TaxID=979708 RepID=A0A9P6K2U9_9FUNG|nr:hypothetical protein EC957_000552 [Mortierella hygrophila]
MEEEEGCVDAKAHQNSHCSTRASVQGAFVTFTRIVYSPEMPASIPPTILIRRMFDKVSHGIQFVLRGILVAFIWLVILPYFTIWIWRLYFWIGETFAFRANGLETPMWNTTTFFSSRHNLTAAPSTSSGKDKALDGISILLFQSIAPEHQWISKFILDCFEGQIISSIVVVTFVVSFLFREWVVQNQEAEVARGPMDDAAAPIPGAEDNAPGFNVEHAVEHLIAAHHQMEALVEGEASSTDSSGSEDDSDSDIDQTRIFSRPTTSSPTDSARPMDFPDPSSTRMTQLTPSIQEPRPAYFWETDSAGEGGSSGPTALPPSSVISPSASSSTLPVVRPSAERTLSSDPTTGAYASTNTLDRSGRRPSALGVRSGQGVSFRAPEDMPSLEDTANHPPPRVGYVYDASQQTFHPDTRWVPATSSSAPLQASDLGLTPAPTTGSLLNIDDAYRANGMRRPWATQNLNGEGPSNSDNNHGAQEENRRRIYSKDGTSLYWKLGVPLSYDNIYLNLDGGEMTYTEKVLRYEELCRTTDVVASEALPIRWRPSDAPRIQQPPEEMPEALDARARQRQEMVRQINERGIRMRRNEPVPAPVPIVRDARAAPLVRPLPPPPPRAPFAPPVRANQDEADDMNGDMNEDELEGILEVIGMHGPYWVLLQNSLLMSALMCASLGLGVWIPFMIGKTTLLMNPFNVLRMPLDFLSRLTDPILDYVIDRMLPFIGTTLSSAWSIVSSHVSPILSPIIGSSLGSAVLKPLDILYDEQIVPLWKAFIESMVAGGEVQDMYPGDSPITDAAQNITQGSLASNGTVVGQIARKWTELAYGSSSGDKMAAVAIGYFILFVLAFWYFVKTEHAYGETFAKMTRDVLRQQGLILRIAFFVAMETVVFPVFCGIAIGLSTLPVFQGATFATRMVFYIHSPNWFLLMHWLVGTAFMFNFSLFVSVCRTVTRPGVMWFIRDPNDQGFNPIREILERPFMWQLRKLGSGAVTYLTLIFLGVTVPIQFVKFAMNGVLPLRWPVDEPISDLPIDLLLFHLVVPLTFRWLDPSSRIKVLFSAWWRHLSRWLRVSSFMYTTDNQRFYEEEGHVVYRTWKAWLLRYRPPIPGLDQDEEDCVGSGEELDTDAPVLFVRDGGWYRVPNTDRIVQMKNRRVLVPVDENGNALDPNDDLPGEVDPLMDYPPHNRDDPSLPVDPKENTTIVYGPPHLKRRLIAFLILVWTSVMTFMVLSVVSPMVLGRAIFSLKSTRPVHDVYSFVVGIYFLSGIWYAVDWTSAKIHMIYTRGTGPINSRAVLNMLWTASKMATKLTYFVLAFGILMPFTLGLMVELFVVLPLRNAIDEEANVIFMVDWAVGLLYMKIIHRILTVLPNNRFALDMNRVFVGTDVNQWDAGLATRRLILPVFGMCALVVAGPFVCAWIAAEALGLEGAARYRIFRQAYPTVMMISLVVFGLWECAVVVRGWSQYVRDQEYLVGRQLHNLREEEIPAETLAAATGTEVEAAVEPIDDAAAEQEVDVVGDGEPDDIVESTGKRIYGRFHSGYGRDDGMDDNGEGSKDASGPTYTPLLRSTVRQVVDPELDLGSDWDDEGSASRTRPRRSLRLAQQAAARRDDSYNEI